jgi:type IV secretory pathway TraG/TraD family ATPase VirD4
MAASFTYNLIKLVLGPMEIFLIIWIISLTTFTQWYLIGWNMKLYNYLYFKMKLINDLGLVLRKCLHFFWSLIQYGHHWSLKY